MNLREDHSRYKKNELGTYLLKKELGKYFENQDKKKKKESNPFVSSIYSSVTSSAIAVVVYYKFNLGEHFNGLKDEDLKKSVLTLVFSFLFAIVYGIIYYIFYNFYYYVINPKMNQISSWFKSRKLMNESNLEKLTLDTSETSYIEKFNHQVADRVAMVLNISEHLDAAKLEEEDIFFMDEALLSLKKALDILELEIMTSEFYYKKVLDPDYTKLKKYRIINLIKLAEKLVSKFNLLAATRDSDFEKDVSELASTLYRIKLELNQESV